MMTATQVEPSLFRKLEDLCNELAYMFSYPERFSKIELLARKVAVLQQIKHIRWLLKYWAMPIELVTGEPVSPESLSTGRQQLSPQDFMGWIIPTPKEGV